MKKLYFLITLVILSAATFKANAQDDGINELFKGNSADVNKLLNAYTGPLFKGFGNGLNGGWTNTAKTLGTFKFNIRVSATVSMISEADKSFNINSLGLTNIKATGSPIAATFGGNENLQAGIQISDPSDPNNPAKKFNTTLPGGVSQYVPAPQIQLTMGLIKNTDVSLRLIPTTKISDDAGSVGMFGVGVKHSISQYFGKAEKVVPFDLAVAVGYTRLSYKKPLEVRPETPNGGVSGNQDYSTQALEGHFSGWNTQVIISKKLAFFTPFVSLGYITSKTDVGLKGNYPFVTSVNTAGQPVYTTQANPITITGPTAQTKGMRADVGFQMSLFFLKIYGSYSFAEYKSANAGIGLGF
ncbi:MAG: hypothetical protein EOP47_23375 [Sphingobacteriaceae bacterium]|nr:MAG: hypothetical protein EOP47_23375 [Sphingobacteriaceae bacterium]